MQATLAPRALHTPPAFIFASAARTFASAASGDALSEIRAATLNELPDGVSTQFGQADSAVARTVRGSATSAAVRQRQPRER